MSAFGGVDSSVKARGEAMAFVRTVLPGDATGLLRQLYDDDVKTRGSVPNFTIALSLRPEVIKAWRALSAAVRSTMDLRRYELVTIAAASRLRCSY